MDQDNSITVMGSVEAVEIVDHFRKSVWQGRAETNLACSGFKRATITCDNCGKRFSYRYRVLGVGTSECESGATLVEERNAYQERYQDALNDADEDQRRNFLRCPYCNNYQDWMKPTVSLHRRRWGRYIVRRLLFATVVVLALIGMCTVILTALWGLPWPAS